MKRMILTLVVLGAGGLVAMAWAGDYHSGSTLFCNDCHTAHGSISPGHGSQFRPDAIGPNGPYADLLLNEVNDLCLSCHNESSIAPDVFGLNHGKYTNGNRRAGALNAAPGHLGNDAGYPTTAGHSLWSTADPPGNDGSYTAGPHGLECNDCHAQHGHKPFQYRNLQQRVSADTVDYAYISNNADKAVFEVQQRAYYDEDVWYNEPHQWSDYARWCGNCHTNFHGVGGDPTVGSDPGGVATAHNAWIRHPVADVNIGTAIGPHYSSLSQYNSHGVSGQRDEHRVKVMDSQGLWNGTSADNTVTPSCFSCHRSHGNKNPFGLIFLTGNGVNPVTEEGDGGVYKNLCRQCHVQGADS